MKLTRLASRDNYRDIEKEWQHEFVYYVLENIDVPSEILESTIPEGGMGALTVYDKIELKKHLNKFDIIIVDDLDGGIKIYVEKQMIAEWKKCKFVIKEDLSEIDPSKRLYMEINADVWTIFDQGVGEE